MYADTNHCFPV